MLVHNLTNRSASKRSTSNYRPFISLIGVICISVSSVELSACGDAPSQQSLSTDSTVIAFGDSLTYGYGATPDTAYPTVLGELTGWLVVNEGVNGDTSADVLGRVDDIIAQEPDLVLLGVGGNDVLQKVASDTTLLNINSTIDELQSADIPVVLIAEPYFSASALLGRASDNPIYETIAEAQDIPLYAGGWSTVISDEELKSDQVHANAQGYRIFAEGLYRFLEDEGFVD